MITDFLHSLTAVFQGVGYVIQNKWVRTYITTAVLLNILAFIIVIGAGIMFFNQVFAWGVGMLGIDGGTLSGIVMQTFAVIIALFLAIVLFGSISSIVNAPVYSIVSERIIKEKLGDVTEGKKRGVGGEILVAIGLEVKKLVLILGIFALSLLFNFLPGIGQVLFMVTNVLQLIIITGVDLFEPIISYQRQKFSEKLSLIMSNPMKYWPFLFIAGTICAIPVLNIITLPICIIGAVLLFTRKSS